MLLHTTTDTKSSSLDMHRHAVDYRKFICLDVNPSGDEEDYGARNNFQSLVCKNESTKTEKELGDSS